MTEEIIAQQAEDIRKLRVALTRLTDWIDGEHGNREESIQLARDVLVETKREG